MPVITIEGPTIHDLDKKRELAREVTQAATKAYGLNKDAIVLILHEVSPECVATGGELVCDRYPAAGGSPEGRV